MRKERVDILGTTVDVDSALSSKDGSFIGDEKFAKRLEDMGILPERARDGDKVASVGFCEAENKWYGWSHRAIHGFGIGDRELSLSPGGDSHGAVIESLDEAREAAVEFADSVS